MLYLGRKTAFFVFFQLFIFVGSLRLLDHPWNMAITVGQLVGMKCKPDNFSRIVEWTIQKPMSHSQNSLWNNWRNEARIIDSHHFFDVDEDRTVTLYINSTQLDDAGIYTCTSFADNTTKQPERYRAQLMILESDPQCNSNLSVEDGTIEELGYIEFRCSVNFSGHWTPSMQWSKGGNALSSTSFSVNISQSVQKLTSVINMQVRAEDNDAIITCETLFIKTTKNISKTSAINVPEYLFSWNTTIDVCFGPMNVTITPKMNEYRWVDVLSCNAIGNPTPSYTWRRAHKTIANGPQLSLTEAGLKANRLQTIECIAQNQVSAQIKQSSAEIDLLISGNSMNIIILIGIICGIVLLVVIFIGKEHMKVWIAKHSSIYRGDLSCEPDILTNADEIQNVPAEILAVESVPECNTNGSGIVAKTPASTQTSIGLDGTVYAELKEDQCLNQSDASASLPQNPLLIKSEYASIDHTTEAPPLPKRK